MPISIRPPAASNYLNLYGTSYLKLTTALALSDASLALTQESKIFRIKTAHPLENLAAIKNEGIIAGRVINVKFYQLSYETIGLLRCQNLPILLALRDIKIVTDQRA